MQGSVSVSVRRIAVQLEVSMLRVVKQGLHAGLVAIRNRQVQRGVSIKVWGIQITATLVAQKQQTGLET